jgi:hypothetical protein
MTLHTALAFAALAGSALLFATGSRILAIIALLASGLEVAMTLGVLHIAVARLPLGLVLGLALALPGLIAWFRATAKPAISAATIVALIGILQVVVHSSLHA